MSFQLSSILLTLAVRPARLLLHLTSSLHLYRGQPGLRRPGAHVGPPRPGARPNRMNTRAASLLTLIALLALSVPLSSCAAELADATITPTPPTPTPPPLPSLPSTPPTSPLPSPHSLPSTPSTPSLPPLPSVPVQHTVQPGDTLLGLAREYGVPMAAIQLQNSMGDSTVVRVGQVLSIPPQAGWEEASAFWVVHVVHEGETLIGNARTYGLKAGELRAANELADRAA